METKAILENSLKDAMRAGDDLRRRTLRMALAAIKITEIDRGAALEEAAVLAILQKEVKSRRESIQDAQKANRPDLEQAALDEIKVLEAYLPQPMPEAELRTLVEQTIAELNATTPADMGKVMKALLPKLQGKVPGDQASAVVRAILQK
jgi:uncharacterized protein